MHNQAKCEIKIDTSSVFMKKINGLFQISGSGSDQKIYRSGFQDRDSGQNNFGTGIRDQNLTGIPTALY